MRDANWRSGGSGVVTVPQILQKSLNVGVSTLIDRYYHKDPRKFVEGIYRIGVAEDLKIPIPGYAKPRIRMPKEDGSNWSKTALPWMSIGYETQIPPITTVTFYNGIANNGKLVRPRLVKAVLKGGEVVKEFPVVVLREQMAKPEAVKNIQDCLESVVSVGLGKKAGSKYFHTSGKTGTAQIWTKNGFCSQYLVSFAGYFPSEEPLYSCIVCIKKGAPASGGGMCAPVFRRVAETVMAQRKTSDYGSARDTVNSPMPMVCAGSLNAAATVAEQLDIPTEGNVQPDASTITWGRCETSSAGLKFQPNEDDHAKVVPDVTGYGLRDALFKLEKAGLKVKTIGLGRVSRQSLPPGKALEPGQEIELVLGNPEVVPKAERPDSVKADTTKAEKPRQEPEDSELTPTLHEEKKLKQQEQAQQAEKKQPAAPKQKAKKDAQVTTKPETQKKKEQEKKSSKKSAHNQTNLAQKRRTA